MLRDHHTFTFTRFMMIIALALLSGVMTFPANAYAAEHGAFLQAFRHSYQNPGDVKAALKYSEEAVKIGNYEAAIPPLERILMFNPKLSEVRLEVGVLYYLLNSSDMAKKHLSMVASDDHATDAAKARANQYLTKL